MERRNITRLLALPVVLLLMAVLLLPATAFADPATAVTVEPASKVVGVGGTFTVDIVVNPDTDIAGAQFGLSFDPSVVTANEVIEGNFLSQGGASTYFITGVIDNAAGTITGVFGTITGDGEPVSQSGIFATISFTAGTAVGTSALDLTDVMVGDLQGQAVDIEVTDGSVTVTGAAHHLSRGAIVAISVVAGVAIVAGIVLLVRRRRSGLI
jgi:Cohesin domain